MIDRTLPGKDRHDAYANGVHCLRRGHEQEAIAWFHHAAHTTPDNGAAHFMAGAYCLWHGRAMEAIDHLRAALDWAAANLEPPAGPAYRIEPEAAEKALFAAIDALNAAGLQPVLNGGTALGCVREGGFIAHDTDLDLGLVPGADAAVVVDAIDAAPGLQYLYHDTYANQVIRVRFQGWAVGGDIFLYQQGLPGDPNAWWCGVQRGTTAVRWRDSPFIPQPHPFLGRTVLLPGPAERYLTENYGDWRHPRPAHIPAFDPPNLVDPNSPMSHALGLRMLCQALREDDRDQARTLCHAVLARRPDDAAVRALLGRLQ